jgi:uncharacterized protein
MRIATLGLTLTLLLAGGFPARAATLFIVPADGAAVVMARARQFDLTSAINGRKYRVQVSTPVQMEAGKRYPVIYAFDGNAYFGIFADSLTRQSVLGAVAPAIVVGIGYPTDNPRDVFPLRSFDLAPSPSTDPEMKGKGGGADAFLRMVEEEIMPLVESRYPVDPARRTVWGHSLGGLAALHSMLHKPGLFANYALSSPSIWWNEREELAAVPAFIPRVRGRSAPLRVLILSASDEQYRGADPEQRANADVTRMVDNATELAARLARLPATDVSVQRVIFADELHETVSPASISRTLRFALPVEK